MQHIVMALCDFYKISHRRMYRKGMQRVYSTWIPRGSRIEGIDEVVWFGGQAFYREYLNGVFQQQFFARDIGEIVREYKRLIKHTLGEINPETQHIEDLHALGFLPLSIKALPEGSVVPVRCPVLTIENTDPNFFWLTNFVESLMSAQLWKASTSATQARHFRQLFDYFARLTVGNTEFVPFQGHDFSFRGMSCLEDAVLSGMGHLTSFVGTDTVPAIVGAEQYYDADVEKEMVGCSIPATEHSIQCSYDNDMQYFETILNDVHPSGFVSIVSDGYDLWNVIGEVLPALKDRIMSREGRVVIRPDSGDPVLIMCGNPDGETELERKGVVEALWDLFGGTTTDKGYKLLDSHIGSIYGDAITYDRASEIFKRLAEKGFASINVVFGIGSFTYQYVTRDTFEWALKSTFCQYNGIEKPIFKSPMTDNGVKKSLKGRVAVFEGQSCLAYADGLDLGDKWAGDLLREVYRDGEILVSEKFSDIRARILQAEVIA